jgi:hypothetical protein
MQGAKQKNLHRNPSYFLRTYVMVADLANQDTLQLPWLSVRLPHEVGTVVE